MTIPPIKFKVDPLMVPASKAARRLGLHVKTFEQKLPELLSIGFPKPHPVLGTYCLQAVDDWISSQAGLIEATGKSSPNARISARIGEKVWQR